jgi:hypothetical protein
MKRQEPLYRRGDGLDAARGIITGIALALPFWACACVVAVWMVTR